MQATDWRGVFPAITTPFREDLTVDHDSLRDHVEWLVEHGSTGIVALGSLGEGATLGFDEKVQILESCKAATGDRVPLVAGISALGTHEAVELSRRAQRVGCDGLMVLPPYVYQSEWREMKAYVEAIIEATPLSCMLYNNPIAYGTDFLPEHIGELCVHENLHAVKESSADIRRVTAIRALLGDRLAIFVGVDDLIVEGIAAGAVGWIAGLVNALPDETMRLFELASAGETEAARSLYEWFLPLLRLDLGPKFVQTIKLVQNELGKGSARVRPPRLELEGAELDAVLSLIREQLAVRPTA
ncbi:MAG TPA: dihydrodipicolinate synthase family protein [Gemmatimonadaceae bacterium]|jgi:4-hydroxy-tetrahydrodipicolinate synthase|nr:dihydrodipicolinate synthase family protein [Gemmatimonadaceae bacterium]